MKLIQSKELKEYNRIYKALDELYHEIALKIGLSDSAFTILYMMCEIGDGCMQKDICNLSFISKQTINSSIRKLEEEGYLILKQGKGRDKHIFLTEIGQKLVEEKIIPVIKIENRAFEEMTPEECQVLLALNKKYLNCLREKAKEIL